MNNSQRAVTFLTLVTANKIDEAYETYVDNTCKHHNLYFAGDAASLAQGMKENAQRFPHKHYEVKHVLAQDDFVAVHAKLQLEENEPVMVVVHLFRFSNEKIVELWDVGQAIPGDSPNENGAF